MDHYSKLRVRRTTNRKLKIMAAVKGTTILQLVEDLVTAEQNRSESDPTTLRNRRECV